VKNKKEAVEGPKLIKRMTKMRLIEALLACMGEDLYGDSAHALLMAKSKVQNQQVFLKNLKNKVSQVKNPQQQASLKAKISQEEEDLKKYQDYMKARELEFQAAKIKIQAKKRADQGRHPQQSL